MEKRTVEISAEELKELKILAEAFKRHMDDTHNGVTVIDTDGKILYLSKWSGQIVKFPKENIIGRNLREFFPNSELLQTLSTKKPERGVVRKDNMGKPRVVNRTPLFDASGEPIGAFSTYKEVEYLQKTEMDVRLKLIEKGHTAKYTFDNIKTKSQALSVVIEQAKLYASSDSPVLIQGESGTGKELFAQSIHNASKRKNGPFVALNCTTLTESILESELFGYSDASFTGAKKGGKSGLFQEAHHGTIFLDEIGEMPISFQAKLLRVLQEKEIRPVGGDKIIPVDVRVISATNKNLMEEVQDGKFRLDLMYRLNVLELKIPPLRKRREDISVIIHDMLKNNDVKKPIDEYIETLLPILEQYDFPGNVRELENIVERIILLQNVSKDSNQNLIQNLKEQLMESIFPISDKPAILRTAKDIKAISDELAEREKDEIRYLMLLHHGSYKKTAEQLGISVSTLRRKIKKYGL